jgi:hypothetical protein
VVGFGNPCRQGNRRVQRPITGIVHRFADIPAGLYKADEQFELLSTLHQQFVRLLREQWKGTVDADQTLVVEAKTGNFAAMESLMTNYERQVFAVARRIVGQHQDAEEVMASRPMTDWWGRR